MKMDSRERVRAALAHVQPDYPPCDYFYTPEIHARLLAHFRLRCDDAVYDALGTDIRYVNPPYAGPALPAGGDGISTNIWGVRKRRMPNAYGDYEEPVDFPYAVWESVEEARRFPWPSPDWYDYGAVPALCNRHPGRAVAVGGFGVQDFINGIAFGRGVERTLVDIALRDPVYLFILEKRHRFYMETIERILAAGRGRIDLVLCGDDFGTQRGLLISPETFDAVFAAKKKEFFDMVHSFGARVTHHCCGSSTGLVPRFIELGMDALQTIQPQAAGMNPYEFKRNFGDRITLHGGIDVQGWLQNADGRQIDEEVTRLYEQVGKGGGFIASPCHNIQPDVPLENVLRLYQALGRSPTADSLAAVAGQARAGAQ
jgi:uroporphyrinogen decarboxylase